MSYHSFGRGPFIAVTTPVLHLILVQLLLKKVFQAIMFVIRLTCPISDENQAFVASGNTNLSWKVESGLVNVSKLLIYFLSCSNATIMGRIL